MAVEEEGEVQRAAHWLQKVGRVKVTSGGSTRLLFFNLALRKHFRPCRSGDAGGCVTSLRNFRIGNSIHIFREVLHVAAAVPQISLSQ